MAKGRGSNRSKTSKPTVKVDDLAPKQNPKGGAVDAFIWFAPAPPPTIRLADGSVVPNPAYLTFQK